MSSELSREEIADMRVQIKAAQSNLWAQVHREALHAKADALCDMALAHLDSKEAGRVSVPREALEAMRDCARELSKKADQHMLGICSPAALALPAVALAGEINDLLSAAPAPAATKGTGEETQADKTLLAMLYLAMRELIRRIEACGASPELTNAVTLASDMLSAIGNEWNPRDSYAAGRVHTTVIEAAKGGK